MSKSSGRRPLYNAVASFIFLVGYGLALHDYAHQVWQLKGYHNLVEGGYVGFALMAPIALACIVVFMTDTAHALRLRAADKRRDRSDGGWFYHYPSKEDEGQ